MPYLKLVSLLLLLNAWNLFAQEFPRQIDPANLQWYTRPAEKWEDALPVGNGRLGAMVYGRVEEEIIQLNEETYWSGGPYSSAVKGGHEKLKEIQQLVASGQMMKAHNLFGRHLMGYPVEQMKYQSLANLVLQFKGESTSTEYKRWLDLRSGVAGVTYLRNGTRFFREVFSSFPDQVIAIRLTADKPGAISFTANLRGVRNQTHSNYGTDYFRMDGYGDHGLLLTGKSTDYLGVEGKIRFEARLDVQNKGGTISLDDHLLTVTGADEVVMYFSAATNFINHREVGADPHQRVDQVFNGIRSRRYDEVKNDHINDFKSLSGRVNLSLGNTGNSFLPTDERMTAIQTSPDPSLAALCYQFGRYLLISSSRPGTQPANLQGIWNNDMNPAWDSKYTTNINTEMNYWAAESGNLSECMEPLTKMIGELTEQGSEVAREHYGARGWVFHQNTDLFRVAAPMDGPTWGTFTTGGAWLVNTAWEHYRHTADRAFAESFYPVMKGSVRFFLDFLTPHSNGKWLVTNPSTSPENFPASPGNGRYFDEVTGSYIPGTTICAGSSIDMQLLHDLFTNYLEAARLLGKDQAFADSVVIARGKLVPPQVGSDGALQEWSDDWGQLEKNHRHFSHLYGLYPGHVLSPVKNPQFMNEVKAVLDQRGDGGTGWSRSWKMALWARLFDGERADNIFKGYLKEQCYASLFSKCFTPLQVDGSLGLSAAVSEMLVQSHEGYVQPLPALPPDWHTGSFSGICVRGGFELELKWVKGKPTKMTVLSKAGGSFRLLNGSSITVRSQGKSIRTQQLKDGLIAVPTVKGVRYEVFLN
ncbi:MAG: glycosyl hydrolase family 95 catalytic domain-containing protein [Bacteroidota bacterium]